MAHSSQLQKLLREIEDRYMPKNGWCDAPGCEECAKAEAQVVPAIEAAKKAYALQNSGAKTELPARRIFEQGYERGHGEALTQAHTWARQSVLRARQEAKNEWYQKGLRDGRANAPRVPVGPSVNETKVHNHVVDEALDACHVIGESNPQMKPAANAIRHRIKKLRR